MAQEHQIVLKFRKFESEKELSASDFELFEAAKKVAQQAYAPYSGFYVGAALRLSNGQIITGNNQENAAYPSGLCAERTAFFYAGAQFPGVGIEKVFVLAKKKDQVNYLMACPCGACRQVMLEYEEKQNNPIQVLMKAEGESFLEIPSISTLLPFKFTGDVLG